MALSSGSRRSAALWLVGLIAATAALGNPPLTTPELLVDLARDHGLDRRADADAADVQHVRALLRAAARLDPKLAEAHKWLYELAVLAGDERAAGEALTALVNADPTHEGAFGRWLSAGVAAQQSIEQRVAWLEAVLAAPRPAGQQAQVHVALARLATERMDWPTAQQHIDDAFALEPASLDAAILRLNMLPPDAPPDERLAAILGVLQRSPLDVAMAWEAATLLDEHGYTLDAARFFEHAASVFERVNPRTRPPGAFLLDRAWNLLAAGQLDAALRHARHASEDPTIAAQAAMFLHYLLEKQSGGTGVGIGRRLAQRFAQIREPGDFPPNEVAQAAWFYCRVTLEPDRALMLARNAAERAPGDPFVQRVLGWALAANEQNDAAREVLRPIADNDPYAAGRLALLMLADGEEEAAADVIARLDPVPVAGPAFDFINRVFREARAASTTTQPTTAPATQPDGPPDAPTERRNPLLERLETSPNERYPGLARVLAEFDVRVLSFHVHAEQYVRAEVVMEDQSLPPGAPWWARFRLQNRAAFPITLGPDSMVNPVFLLSFTIEGDRKLSYPGLMTVAVDRQRVLAPGEAVEVRKTLDVGPLRRIAWGSPQQAQRVRVDVVLDAVQRFDGSWVPSAGGQSLSKATYFNRLPTATGRAAELDLFQSLSQGSRRTRVRVLGMMAQLLSEHQRDRLGRLEYRPSPVPAARLERALLEGLASSSWELRVRTLDALQIVGLTSELLDAASACLEHEHWLVRMMAVRLLARQGESFVNTAAGLARNDPDELVRALAESYVQQWRSGAPEE